MKVVLWFLMMFMPLMANVSSVNEEQLFYNYPFNCYCYYQIGYKKALKLYFSAKILLLFLFSSSTLLKSINILDSLIINRL